MKFYLRDILYASPAFAFALPTFPVIIFLPALYTEILGYDVGQVGFFLFIAKILDIISDPIVGWLNDKRILSRKFLIVIGSIISAIALCKLFLITQVPYKEYLLVWIAILYLGWTIFQIPYLSIGYDLEDSYFYRTKLSAMRETFILMGLFSSLCIPMLFKIDNVGLAEHLVKLALVSGLIGVFFLCFFINEKRGKKKRNSIKNTLDNIASHSRLRKLLLIWFFNTFANVFPMILFAFYITYVLEGNDYDRQRTLFFYFLFAIIGVPFWTQLSKKTNKAKAWSISLITSSTFFIFVIFLNPGDIFLFIIISCLTGFCLGADLVLPPSIQADITDMHEQKYKQNISGVLFSLITAINKLSFALGSLFVFGILGFLDFSTDLPASQNSKIFIISSYAIAPVILKIISYFMLSNFKSSEDELMNIQKKIK
ncbi:MAG: MFS transporter [Pseudomonadota bacterium]|nr:MFS transporter [Pseudomonadota bacterium]